MTATVARTEGWVGFRPTDATVVVALVRTVAARGDAGEHGHGAEVVIETPSPGWFGRVILRRGPAQARLVVTKSDGRVGYPFDVRLVSEHDGHGARKVGARPGWAISNTAGMAFLIQKGGAADPPDFDSLVSVAVAALQTLRPRARERGWRASIDRSIERR